MRIQKPEKCPEDCGRAEHALSSSKRPPQPRKPAVGITTPCRTRITVTEPMLRRPFYRTRAFWTSSCSKRKALRFVASSALQDEKQKCESATDSSDSDHGTKSAALARRAPKKNEKFAQKKTKNLPVQKTLATSLKNESDSVGKCEQLTAANYLHGSNPTTSEPSSSQHSLA